MASTGGVISRPSSAEAAAVRSSGSARLSPASTACSSSVEEVALEVASNDVRLRASNVATTVACPVAVRADAGAAITEAGEAPSRPRAPASAGRLGTKGRSPCPVPFAQVADGASHARRRPACPARPFTAPPAVRPARSPRRAPSLLGVGRRRAVGLVEAASGSAVVGTKGRACHGRT